MALTNAERRTLLLKQHEHLRGTIGSARAAAKGVLTSSGSPRDLTLQVQTLADELRSHLIDEEQLLEPILSDLDAWGPIRLALLHAEHAHQRAVLTILTNPVSPNASLVIAGRTLGLCDDLMADMEFEERELINDAVLRDDLVLMDASDA